MDRRTDRHQRGRVRGERGRGGGGGRLHRVEYQNIRISSSRDNTTRQIPDIYSSSRAPTLRGSVCVCVCESTLHSPPPPSGVRFEQRGNVDRGLFSSYSSAGCAARSNKGAGEQKERKKEKKNWGPRRSDRPTVVGSVCFGEW